MNVRRTIKRALLASVVVVAVILTAARLLLPQLDSQQQQIGQQISKMVGLPVEFSGLSVRLFGISPEITLSDVVIKSARNSRPVLAVDQLKLRLSILGSIISRQPVLELLKITGIELSVERDADRFRLVGFSAQSADSKSNSDLLADWLLAQQRLQLFDARVHYKDLGRQFDLQILASSVQFESVSAGVELSGRLKLDGDLRGNLELAGSIKAFDAADLNSAPWQLYLDVQGLELASATDRKLQVGGKLALQGWLHGEGLSMAHIDGGLQWSDPLLTHTGNSQRWSGKLFQSRFGWNRLATGWRGRLHELRFESELENWQGRELRVNSAAELLRIDGGDIDLQVAATMAALLIEGSDQKQAIIANLAPVGVINDFKVDLVPSAETGWGLENLAVDFDGVGFDAFQSLPAIRGFSGRLIAVKQQGWLDINSTDLTVAALKLFPEVFSFDRLSTQIDWRRVGAGDDLMVNWRDLKVTNRDLTLNGRGNVTVYPDQSPVLRTVVGVEQFDIAQIGRYLPAKVIPAGVVGWLTGALVSGRLVDTGLIWNGKLADYPYTQNDQVEGLFVAHGKVEGAELNYVPGSTFPEISRLDADIVVTGRRMEIKGHRGFIFDSVLSEVTAVIENLASRNNHVTVTGQVDGALHNGLRYLTESPLNRSVGRYVSDLTATGVSHLQLDLDIPFNNGRQVQVDGVLELPGNQLDFSNTRLSLGDAKGTLKFDQIGIYGTGLSANLFGGPALISIDSITDAPNNSVPHVKGELAPSPGIMIRGTGVVELERVAEYINWSEFDVTTGAASWDASLKFFAGGLGLRLTADLAEATINLPPPLAKAKNQRSLLALELACQCSQPEAVMDLSLNLDDQWYVDLELARNDKYPGVSRGVVAGARPGTLPADGILLDGIVPRIDFGQWQQWIAALPTGGSGGSAINRVDLQLEQLDIFGQRFPDIHINGELHTDRWRLNVESAEAQGRVVYQPNPALIDLDFNKLSLFTDNTEASLPSQSGFVDFPSLDVNIDNFLLNGVQMGRLALTAEPVDSSELAFPNIQLTSLESQLSASGVWRQDTEQGVVRETSYFQGNLETDNFGDVLALVGQPQSVSGGEGDAHWALNWTGGPQAFSLANLSGDLALKMKDGSLMGLEPGLGRLFGLLSLDSFQRRISLDFRDLVGTGFAFDKLQATISAVDGQLALSTLKLKGPAADIKVSGNIELENLSLSLTAEAIPKVTESLPLAVTIGSPGLGAAIFIGQKLLGNRIDDVTGRTYRITGTADQPVVELVEGNVFRKLLGGKPDSGLGG